MFIRKMFTKKEQKTQAPQILPSTQVTQSEKSKVEETKALQDARTAAIDLIKEKYSNQHLEGSGAVSLLYASKLNLATEAEIPHLIEEYEKKLSKLKKAPLTENELKNRYYDERLTTHALVIELGDKIYYETFATELWSEMEKYHQKFINNKFSESILSEYVKFNENLKATFLEKKVELLCKFVDTQLQDFSPISKYDEQLKSELIQSKQAILLMTETKTKKEALSLLEMALYLLCLRQKSSKEANVSVNPSAMYSQTPTIPSSTSLNSDEKKTNSCLPGKVA